MTMIEFTAEEKATLVGKLQRYFECELDQDIGQFDAEFLLDFFSTEIGRYYYNRGLMDARLVVEAKLDDIDADIYALEKATEFSK